MAIVFQCNCGKSLKAKDELAGRRVKCPDCETILHVPAPQATEPEPDAYGLHEEEPAPPPRVTAPSQPTFQPAKASARTPARASAASKPSAATMVHAETTGSSPREFLYFLLLLALIPLVLSVLMPAGKTIKERLDTAFENVSAETAAKIGALENQDGVKIDDLLPLLPGGKLDDEAHLPRNTWIHWLYGGIAAALFWAFTLMVFPREKKTAHHLLLVGLFTGTAGVLLLLGFQFAAEAAQGLWLRGRSIIVLIFYVVKFIGWSYTLADDPNSNVFVSMLGFTCGVGLCEELCKALPILIYFRRHPSMGWRGAAVWGLASGVGFGVAEGIMYSANYYNGISSPGIYFVRFVSCVALHAIWSATVGISAWKRQESIEGDIEWGSFVISILAIIGVPMILHGLYDTLLKKDMDVWALVVGAATFAWFAFQVETARATDAEMFKPKKKSVTWSRA